MVTMEILNELKNIGMLGLSKSDSDDNEIAIIAQLDRPHHSSTSFNPPTINTEHSLLINPPAISNIGMEIMIDKKLWNQRIQDKCSMKNQLPKPSYKNRK